ncbi:MAG: hypothetical protein OEM67_10870 [Thermoleophilia bacterium]|nr:hypothetical protein [Thermoleophilia bacterium]
MSTDRTLYEERTPWPGWVGALFWGLVALMCVAMLAGWDTSLPLAARVVVTALIAGSAVGLNALIGRLTVRVQEMGILLHLGSVPLIRRRVPFTEVLSATSIQYRPLVEFGGWGVRGVGKRKAWTARGDRAVSLELTEGRQLLIGSDRPERLEDRIRAAAGDRLKWDRIGDRLGGSGGGGPEDS